MITLSPGIKLRVTSQLGGVGGGGGGSALTTVPSQLPRDSYLVRMLPSSYGCAWEISIKHKSSVGVCNFWFLCVLICCTISL